MLSVLSVLSVSLELYVPNVNFVPPVPIGLSVSFNPKGPLVADFPNVANGASQFHQPCVGYAAWVGWWAILFWVSLTSGSSSLMGFGFRVTIYLRATSAI